MELYHRVQIQLNTQQYNGKELGTMCMIAYRIQIKMRSLDFPVKLQLRLEKTSFKQDINKRLKVFGKITMYKMKILMIFHRQMRPH